MFNSLFLPSCYHVVGFNCVTVSGQHQALVGKPCRTQYQVLCKIKGEVQFHYYNLTCLTPFISWNCGCVSVSHPVPEYDPARGRVSRESESSRVGASLDR